MSIVDRLAGRMSLRLRIFLFFALAALASIALIAVAGYFALMATNLEDRTFVLRAGIVSCFGILGILAAIWYQFDSHVARPVERLWAICARHRPWRGTGGSRHAGSALSRLSGARAQ